MKEFSVFAMLLVSTVFSLLFPAGKSEALLMSPSGQNVFSYKARSTPIVSDEPAMAAPLALGAAAEGGPTLAIRSALAETEPVDLYFALSIPGTGGEIFLLTEAGTAVPLSSAGLVPWKTNFSGPLSSSIVEGMPVSALPAGTYTLAMAAAPAGRTDSFNLWITTLYLPGTGLDQDRTATSLVSSSIGGTISTTASDGTQYTLSIPPDAIPGLRERRITVTPITNVAGLPVSGQFVAGISLSPDGLDMILPATVTIHLPHDIDPATLIGFSRSAGDPDFRPLPLFPTDFGQDSVTLRLTHFSEYGLATGTNEDLGTFPISSGHDYDYFRRLFAGVLNDLVAGQFFGAGGYEELSPEMLAQLKDLLKQAGAEAIIPKLEGADNLPSLEAGMEQFFEWVGDINDIFENDPDLSSLVDQAGSIIADKVPGFFQGQDQACRQQQDDCAKKEYVQGLLNWTAFAQKVGNIISKSITLPSPEAFCDGVIEELVDRIFVKPAEEWVIQGGRFQVTAEARNWRGWRIETPITFSHDNPAVADFDPESGIGNAKAVGRTLVTATAEKACGETESAEISVVSLTGSWGVSLTNHQSDCIPRKPFFGPNSLDLIQDGERLSTIVPNYGPVTGSITNLSSLRGQDPTPYRFELGPKVFKDTPDCGEFYSNIDAFMGDNSCTPNRVICTPLYCEETVGTRGGTVTDRGTVMKSVAGSETYWEIDTVSMDDPNAEPYHEEDSCDEWGDLKMTKH